MGYNDIKKGLPHQWVDLLIIKW